MRFALVTLVVAVPALATAVPGHAQSAPDAVLVPTANAVLARDWDRAETLLNAALERYPDRPELLLNLARVYADTGRLTRARELAYRVLHQEPIPVDLANGAALTSHDAARRMLLRVAARTR